MGLLSKLRSLFGGGDERPPRHGDVDVTVEREPSTVAESEGAVAEPGPEPSGEVADEAADEEAAEPDAPDGPGAEPVERIKGIGPSYAGRLEQVGVETVGGLADREPESLAAETDISEKRLDRWIRRARARVR